MPCIHGPSWEVELERERWGGRLPAGGVEYGQWIHQVDDGTTEVSGPIGLASRQESLTHEGIERRGGHVDIEFNNTTI